MLKLGELGRFGIYNLGELGEVSFGMLILLKYTRNNDQKLTKLMTYSLETSTKGEWKIN